MAVRLRKVARNVALDTTLPKLPEAGNDEDRKAKAFTQAEVGRLLHGLQGNEQLHVPVAIAAGTGLRRGEVCALRWRDIEDGAINVTGNIAERTRKAPKTKASRRRVPIAGELVTLLAVYRAQVAEQGLRMGRALEGDDLLFPAKPDAPTMPLNPRAFGQRFENAARKIGLEGAHFHRLRHYHATVLLERGERVEVVAERLGHSSPAVTLNLYASVLEAAKTKAAATAGAVLDEALAWAPASIRRVATR
jgi:integrase